MSQELQVSYNKTGATIIAKASYVSGAGIVERTNTVTLTEVDTYKYFGEADDTWQSGDTIYYYEDTDILGNEVYLPYSDLETSLDLVSADIESVKVETDKLADTLEDNSGTYRFTSAALSEAPTSKMNATELAEAMKAITGLTAGGNWTWQKITKVMIAFAAGNWRKKATNNNIQQLLDPDDETTVILEQQLTSSPDSGENYKTVTILI
jgi:hypothetical protein